MSKTKNSKKGKGTYAVYKADNRAWKNKVRKLETIVRNCPNDVQAKVRLEKLKKGGPNTYKPRQKPLVPGSNKTIPKKSYGFVLGSETAGEQLSKLLGIPLPKKTYRRNKVKASVTVKKKKDVEKP